jgi:hypothetical protein
MPPFLFLFFLPSSFYFLKKPNFTQGAVGVSIDNFSSLVVSCRALGRILGFLSHELLLENVHLQAAVMFTFVFQIATKIIKFMIDNFGVSNLFGRDNYEYYARITGSILKVENDWIIYFKYPLKSMSSEYTFYIFAFSNHEIN